jgi:hypothetical protein
MNDPSTNQNSTEACSAESASREAIDETLDSVEKLFAEERRLREQPPTDEQLCQIWPAWDALPDRMIPEVKVWVLGGSFYDRLAFPSLVRSSE